MAGRMGENNIQGIDEYTIEDKDDDEYTNEEDPFPDCDSSWSAITLYSYT